MPHIFLDGEAVDFSGKPPESLQELMAILANHLSQNGALLTRFVVDGKECLEQTKLPTSYKRVDAYSKSQEAAFEELIEGALNASAQAGKTCEHFAAALLVQPWNLMAPKIGTLVEQLLPLIECFSCLESYAEGAKPAWEEALKKRLKAFDKQLNLLTDASQRSDAALVAEILALDIAPLVKESVRYLQDTLKPYFKDYAATPL